MDNLCQVCGSEKTKLVPAGVSKTKVDKFGNPAKYAAFYTCPNNCKRSFKPAVSGDSMVLEEMVDFRREVNERLDKLISYVVEKLK